MIGPRNTRYLTEPLGITPEGGRRRSMTHLLKTPGHCRALGPVLGLTQSHMSLVKQDQFIRCRFNTRSRSAPSRASQSGLSNSAVAGCEIDDLQGCGGCAPARRAAG
jgi:hypothetical protein